MRGVRETLTADLAFQLCANAAAAAYQRAPAFVTYRVTTHVSVPSLKRARDIVRSVAVRTRDDMAVIQDLPKGRNQVAHGFPVTPTFDALSYFTLSWASRPHDIVEAYVHDVTPLTYNNPGANASADVVVYRLRYFRAAYADDSSDAPDGRTHIHLEAFDFVKAANRPDKTIYFSDVYIDNATGLPARVRFTGQNEKEFIVDYTTIDGHWLINHAHYEETVLAPLKLARVHGIADAVYDSFEFPERAPDPRLAL